MTAMVSSQVQCRWEIWKSLIAVLRSYSALAGVVDGVEIKVDPDGITLVLDTVFVESKHATISLSFTPSTGNGSWTMRESKGATKPGTLKRLGIKRYGQYVMVPDGTLFFEDGFVELDRAATDFVAKLVSFERLMEGEELAQ